MQRTVLAFTMLLAIAVPCQAGDKAKPNTLTPKEIADGWISLFDGETTFGWRGYPWTKGRQGNLKVLNGVLDLTRTDVGSTLMIGEFELQFEYQSTADHIIGVKNGSDEKDEGSGLRLPRGAEWTKFSMRVADQTMVSEVQGKREAKTRKSLGSIWFVLNEDGLKGEAANLKVRAIKVRPLNTQSIFNGKDLGGWKEFPGKKSKFAVNEKGELNVKDGPGDLQTVGKYKNFVLQLECISNGKHLNSGIFFRCRDNEYQNGYEAQIRNQFTAEATQKYLIEEYDPKTNKLVGKKEIVSTAFDYGTGAIYRRVPARKAMSKDGEWFGMTIVAHGNHLATWVNGVQVADWHDHRPKSDNARTGNKLEAGHISIQGHDPTTDLSFRNFRIAELP